MRTKLFGDEIESKLSKEMICLLRPAGHCDKAKFGSNFLEASPEETMDDPSHNFQSRESIHIFRAGRMVKRNMLFSC